MRLRAAILLFVAAGTAGAQSPSRAELVGRLDSLTRDFLITEPAAGVTVAVIKGRDTILHSGFGERDRDRHVGADRSTIYRIGSITKQFTSAAILQHVEAGRLTLTDTLGTLLPQYPLWKSITLRQLLNHTSGIRSYTATRELQQRMGNAATPAEVMAFVEKDTFDFAPGTRYRYNNSGYFLLGMLLERLEKKSYADIMRDRFFKPLGMRSAEYCPNTPTNPEYATGYDLDGPNIRPARATDMSLPYSAGAICMSVPDYLTWQTALTSGQVLKPATYAMMTTAEMLSNGNPIGYGLGLVPANIAGHRVIHHGGDISGFSTQQMWFPDDSLRVVVFANTLGSNPDRLARNLAAAVLGLPIVAKPQLPPAVALAAADRAKYEGTYDLALAGGRVLPLRIFAEGGAMMSQAEGPGQGKIPLRYLGNDTFGAEFDVNLRLTILFEGARAVKARLLQGGGTVEGVRRP